MTKAEADQVAGEVMAELEEEIAEVLDDVTVYVVDGRADPELKEAIRNAGLLRAAIPGNFRGIFLGVQATDDGATPEGSIVLNARNLSTAAEVRDTLAHEIGHALGMDEEEVENLGLG